MVEVSVIIPVYNVEKYLKECLDSVVNQTFEDIEIICVNDGSSDSSLSILEQYACQDDRIIIFSQENKGLGASRNVGLNIAKGKYVLFVDSDDYLELNALKELYDISEEKSLDVLIFKLINFYDETKESFCETYHEMPYFNNHVKDICFNYEDISDFVIDVDVTAYTKFFKKDFISDFRFNEHLIFEDNLFTMQYIFKAKRMYFYDSHLYHRRIRENSIITNKSKNYADVIPIFNLIIEKIKEYGIYDEFKEELFRRKIQAIFFRFNLIAAEFKEYFFTKIKEDFFEKQQEYENEINFEAVDLKFKLLFYCVLESDSYNQFELKVEKYELKNKLAYLQNQSLILEKKVHKLSHKNKKLTKKYNKLNSELKKSNNSKLAKLFNK